MRYEPRGCITMIAQLELLTQGLIAADEGDGYYESDDFWTEGMSPKRECEPGARLSTEGEGGSCGKTFTMLFT